MSFLKNFTHQYSISKTLRFELKPQGKTEENIQKDQVLEQDKQKADSYKKVKVIIDDFHRDFIEKSLSGFKGDWQDLFNKITEIKKADREEKYKMQKDLKKIQESYRRRIVEHIKNQGKYPINDITSAPLIKTILKKYVEGNEEKQELLNEFKGFDGYFSGLHETRRNIYSDKDQMTALSHRIVHDNFEKFLDNFDIYEKHFDKIKNHQSWEGVSKNFLKLGEDIKSKEPTEIIQYIEDFFAQDLDAFNQCLNQSGIERFNKNIVAPINLFFNSYYQQHGKAKEKKIPFFKELFKQILAKSDKGQWVDKLKNDKELIIEIQNFQESLKENKTLENLKEILSHFDEYNLDKIYWQHDQLANLSTEIFSSWSFIGSALNQDYSSNNPEPKNKTQEGKKEKWLKQNFSINYLQQAIDSYINENQFDNKNCSILAYLKDKLSLLEIDGSEYENIAVKYENSTERNLIKSDAEDDVEIIKNLLDSYNEVLWLLKPFMLKKDNSEKDHAFYADLEKPYFQLLEIIHLYNLARDYVTQKSYSIEKYKLNFENPTLGDGWDINKEIDNTSVILEKDGLYYLAIINKKHKKIFREAPEDITGECYQKLNYKLLSGANKTLPKVFLPKRNIKKFNPSQKIIDLYKNEEHKKGAAFSIDSCHQLINFFKDNINEYKVKPNDEYGWEVFDFKFSPTTSYEDISQFYKEVDQQGYKIWFKDISKTYIDDCVDKGEVYLFQIYNKDFSIHSKGKKNLHTLYWQEIFSHENIEDTIYKLSGKAELFFRRASIKENITHPKNQKIQNKQKGGEALFVYDLIKDRRYTKNKYFFHVPISINFKARDTFNFDKKVRNFLKDNNNTNIIGIDRGERNLAYYIVIDQKGKIIEQESLNKIGTTDYHKLLDTAEKERDKSRKNWKTINKIKDLKKGYVSQVVHKISELMIKHNAIVVMEDLNKGMKRGRQKIEKQVYQNLEKALIQKLNYLSFKDYEIDKVGSIRHGLQLTARFNSFEKMGKQTGFIFYVSAPYTSKIDFQTGFAPFKYFKYENIDKSQGLMGGITSIDHKEGAFVVDIDYQKIPKSQGSPKTQWKLYLDTKERYEWVPKDRRNNKVNVYQKLKEYFEKNNIRLDGNIVENIISAKNAGVYKMLFKYLNLVSQMRFTSDKGEDYILSPIAPHFRTDLESETLPKDSDANGAYHIALKGLYTLKECIDKDNNLFIKNEDWFEYAQKMAKER